jgi:hypothetical protein
VIALGRSQAHRTGQLKFFGEHAALADASTFADWMAPLRQMEWVVYAKRPFAGPDAVLAYLARYTHRVALDEYGVTFKWKDYRAKGRTTHKTMTLISLRRTAVHALPVRSRPGPNRSEHFLAQRQNDNG